MFSLEGIEQTMLLALLFKTVEASINDFCNLQGTVLSAARSWSTDVSSHTTLHKFLAVPFVLFWILLPPQSPENRLTLQKKPMSLNLNEVAALNCRGCGYKLTGTSLSKPHTSGTALQQCVCMFVHGNIP